MVSSRAAWEATGSGRTALFAALAASPNPDLMSDIFQQLGDLVLGSVPTMLFFVLLVAAYGLLVRRPLDRILTERYARTSGAVDQARGAIAAAEAETGVYEDKLRSAKAEIFALRARRIAAWQAERDATLAEVREVSSKQIELARQSIAANASEARIQVEAASGDLASRVLAAVLPLRGPAQGAAQ